MPEGSPADPPAVQRTGDEGCLALGDAELTLEDVHIDAGELGAVRIERRPVRRRVPMRGPWVSRYLDLG